MTSTGILRTAPTSILPREGEHQTGEQQMDLSADFSSADPVTVLAAAAGCPYERMPGTGTLFVYQADQVVRLLSSEDLSAEHTDAAQQRRGSPEEREAMLRLLPFFGRWPVFTDGEYHERVRRAVVRGLRGVPTRALTAEQEKFLSSTLKSLDGRSFDWIKEIAAPLAESAVFSILGSNEKILIEAAKLIMNEVAANDMNAARGETALRAVSTLREWVQGQLGDPPSAFVREVANLWNDESYGPDSATAVLAQVITGSYDPIISVLGGAVEYADARALRELRLDAVREEILRYTAPFRATNRYARRPVKVGEHELKPGERVVLVLASANFDPGVYADPLEFRDRSDTPRLFSFGGGQHYCPGASLARQMLDTLLRFLITREIYFAMESVEREPELSMLRYRHLHGRLRSLTQTDSITARTD